MIISDTFELYLVFNVNEMLRNEFRKTTQMILDHFNFTNFISNTK